MSCTFIISHSELKLRRYFSLEGYIAVPVKARLDRSEQLVGIVSLIKRFGIFLLEVKAELQLVPLVSFELLHHALEIPASISKSVF